MRLIKSLILIGLTCSLHSCIITISMRSIQVETMKPAVFTIPDSIKSIGVFNLSPYKKNNLSLEYLENDKISEDDIVNYKQISDKCTKALVSFLEKEAYFKKVRNFGDSINYLESDSTANDIFKKFGIDACLFLDDIDFKIIALDNGSEMIVNNAQIIWSLAYKNDSMSYYYNQNDTLIYDDDKTDLFYQRNNLIRIGNVAINSGEYLGKAFGAKVIPTWIQVERMYYASNNLEMLKAEKFAKNNEWIKAAEIWRIMTKNKNTMIAAKASYNMALVCEMEGHLDAANDWLVQSYSTLKENNKEQKENCQRYINLLAMRKKEIEKLAKQVRNN